MSLCELMEYLKSSYEALLNPEIQIRIDAIERPHMASVVRYESARARVPIPRQPNAWLSAKKHSHTVLEALGCTSMETGKKRERAFGVAGGGELMLLYYRQSLYVLL